MTSIMIYNIPEVIKMSARVKKIFEEISNTFTKTEMLELFKELYDKIELYGMLQTVEPTFADWDNEGDRIYDKI